MLMAAEPVRPSYVVVGHITRDLLPTGESRMGGTATYAAVTAARLGYRVGVLTSARPDDVPRQWLAPASEDTGDADGPIAIACVSSSCTTTFENSYVKGQRRQIVRNVAAPLTTGDIPADWRGVDILHLGPVAAEVDDASWGSVGADLLGLTPQGWMRRWDADGQVWPVGWQSAPTFAAMSGPGLVSGGPIVVLSIEDVGHDQERIQSLAHQFALVVVTTGCLGASVFWRGTRHEVPAYATREVDLTGAGDVFAAAFFIRMHEGADPVKAACFANAAASLAIQEPGLGGISHRQEVEQQMHLGQRMRS
jgi:sugar/nucleoside kinase (ribokinase family)